MDRSTQYKIFNDPVHGFITIPKGLMIRLIDHPYFQRLRRIRQLGLAYLVFPAAEHSRFSHAVGAMELGQRVIKNLREKNTTISDKEAEGTMIALLLHDIGHGPLSHTLEHVLVQDFHHEMMTLKVMKSLNEEFMGDLDVALAIFENRHPKKFLHQLVSSQLDLDRLDYLKRDSFFTGVSEGAVGINRILKTMRVFNGNVVIERKGIYAVENYILARRLMYMQVYLHKTVLAADALVGAIFRRVKWVLEQGVTAGEAAGDAGEAGDAGRNSIVPMPSYPLSRLLTGSFSAKRGISNELMELYLQLDDHDVFLSLKQWANAKDPVLADLCRRFLNRSMFRTTFVTPGEMDEKRKEFEKQTRRYLQQRGMPDDEAALSCYLHADRSYSEAYKYRQEQLWILDNGTAVEFSKAVDAQHIMALSKPVIKPYLVHLKEID